MNYLTELFCTTAVLMFAETPYTVQVIPKGECSYCCPLDPENDVTFHFYSKVNNEEERVLHEEYQENYFIVNNKTIVIYIHGFTEQESGPGAQTIKNAYMEGGNHNVILVDWSKLAALPWYDHAVDNTRHVATAVANFIDDLVMKKGVNLERFHLVGFSLGAEISGLIGKMLRSGKLSRITGLDPALPLYAGMGRKSRLDSGDALFVDVIHTDGGIFGFPTPMGHADFYPNGGIPVQPGCNTELAVKEKRYRDYVACSHNRAWKYFAESVIDPYKFPAALCQGMNNFERGDCRADETSFMGLAANHQLKGKYFLMTNDKAPFGRGLEGLGRTLEANLNNELGSNI